MAIAASVLCGARLANTLGANFNIREIEDYLITSYLNMRSRVVGENLIGSSYENTTEALTGFIKAHSYDDIRTEDMHSGRGKPKKVKALTGPDPNRKYEVNIQWVMGKDLVRLSRAKFYKFMEEHRHSPADVIGGLRKHYGMVEPMPTADLTAGTIYSAGPEPLIVLPVPRSSWLYDVMHNQITEETTPPDQLAGPLEKSATA